MHLSFCNSKTISERWRAASVLPLFSHDITGWLASNRTYTGVETQTIHLQHSRYHRCVILIGLVERTSFRAWTSSTALNENGHIAETDGNKVHHQEEIVIVGGGLGALCFAAALHRLGLRAVVLEKSDRMRSEGTAIVLWTNAMHILEVLDLADQFRSMYINLPGPHEMHSVERKVLLEAFAGQIPQGTIRLNSQVTSIKKSETSPDVTNLELQDGSTYSAKVVVGFDDVNSVVGSWLGLEKPKSVGQVGIRGMAKFHNEQNFENLFRIFCWRNITPEQIKQEDPQVTTDFRVPEIEFVCQQHIP
ncbi:unnamed protein product [Sphagnum jensenii]|uniref:FAD-binding domain-containing protein n=1 Tax=Sphagnum jensenii TaxID=128206 RepID=A0ABP0X2F8_9BRYO